MSEENALIILIIFFTYMFILVSPKLGAITE